MSEKNLLKYRAMDGRFSVTIASRTLQTIRETCDEHPNLETGGILIGRYNDQLSNAHISRVTGPPKGSVFKRATFLRGTKGLKSLLLKCWNLGEYYLGEWHFHPLGSTEPSRQDISQMAKIASDTNYACPEPILLILGPSEFGRESVRVVIVDQSEGVITLA